MLDSVVRTRLAIAGGVVLVVAAAALLWQFQEASRPVPVEVRVVTASESDPVFRDGARLLQPGETYELAVALRLEQRGRDSYWISPAEELELDGRLIEHDVVASWPEEDRYLRVLWHTIEGSFLGGELTANNAEQRLTYRTFFAPELGREARVAGHLEPHNDDFLAEFTATPEQPVGTLRYYARAEVVRALTDVRADHTVASLGVESLHDPRLPTVHQQLQAPDGVRPEVGELFLLPGFELGEELAADPRALPVNGQLLTEGERAKRRLSAASWTFAATAAGGDPELSPELLTELGSLKVSSRPGTVTTRTGVPLSWGTDVRPGDLLRSGPHWMVLLADDGDGTLGLSDIVIHCWRRPAAQVALLNALDLGTTSLGHLRWVPEPGG